MPVTTYHAYNRYGGKSFYVNGMDKQGVDFVSTQRPMTNLSWNDQKASHHVLACIRGMEWFERQFPKKVIAYPDYYLEAHPECFENAHTIVLMEHCEYFSSEMYANLKYYSKSKKLISLGGNQVYWKVRWLENFTKLEVHKDGQFFENTNIPGGRWRNELVNEAMFLGVAYNGEAYETYAPYQMQSNAKLLGQLGYRGKGLSGHEMDMRYYCSPSTIQLLAKGLNSAHFGAELTYYHQTGFEVLSFGSTEVVYGLEDTTIGKIIHSFIGGR